jgi:hypothetical protein
VKDKVKIQFATFPYGGFPYAGQGANAGIECVAVRNWLIQTVRKIDKDPRCELLEPFDKADTPVYMTRNEAVEDAKKKGTDLLIMIDNDIRPDTPEVGAKPFWDSSFDFWWNATTNKPAQSPCIIGAPYCGPPPKCNVFVARWTNWANPEDCGPDARIVGLKLNQYSREEAAVCAGFERVVGLPTGLIMIDMRVFDKMPHPYFQYEWDGEHQACHECYQKIPGKRIKKSTTEDFYFSRTATEVGIPVFVNWDAWVGHYKLIEIGKPKLIHADAVQKLYREMADLDYRIDERYIEAESNSNINDLKEAIKNSTDKEIIVADKPAPPRLLSHDEVAAQFPCFHNLVTGDRYGQNPDINGPDKSCAPARQLDLGGKGKGNGAA